MLQNLKNFISAKLGKKLNAEDRELIRNLEIGDKIDEEVAYAVVLVDLALSDGTITNEERSTIAGALNKIFPSRSREVESIIDEAVSMLANFRSEQMFIDAIRGEYSDAERQRLLALIEEVIAADGHTDEMEVFLSDKFKALLN